MRLQDLRWPEVAGELDRGTPVILPFGSLEQHGPHLPFDTDTICVQAVADRAAEQAGALALPALSYGAPSRPRSGGGAIFPLGAEIPLGTYHDVVEGIVFRLLRQGVRNLALMTWHTENAAVLYDAAREALSRAAAAGVSGAKIVNLDEPGNFITAESAAVAFVDGPVPGKFEHAGLIETSVMMAIDETAVWPHDDIAVQLPSLPYDVLPQPDGMVSPTGSFTDPTRSTAAAGQLLLDDIVPGVAGVLDTEFGDRRTR
jgi:creatinine amidohydrolase